MNQRHQFFRSNKGPFGRALGLPRRRLLQEPIQTVCKKWLPSWRRRCFGLGEPEPKKKKLTSPGSTSALASRAPPLSRVFRRRAACIPASQRALPIPAPPRRALHPRARRALHPRRRPLSAGPIVASLPCRRLQSTPPTSWRWLLGRVDINGGWIRRIPKGGSCSHGGSNRGRRFRAGAAPWRLPGRCPGDPRWFARSRRRCPGRHRPRRAGGAP